MQTNPRSHDPAGLFPADPQTRPEAPPKPPAMPVDAGSRTSSPSTRTKARQAPAREGMVLDNEAGLHWKSPPWSLVARVLRDLDPGLGNSFACLSVPGYHYVQCLRGFNGWHLEWRVSGESPDAYVHFRACRRDGSPKPIELKKHDFMSADHPGHP